eukprot:scaffold98255_cov60-Phaeocystis_antarctica.AAC.1
MHAHLLLDEYALLHVGHVLLRQDEGHRHRRPAEECEGERRRGGHSGEAPVEHDDRHVAALVAEQRHLGHAPLDTHEPRALHLGRRLDQHHRVEISVELAHCIHRAHHHEQRPPRLPPHRSGPHVRRRRRRARLGPLGRGGRLGFGRRLGRLACRRLGPRLAGGGRRRARRVTRLLLAHGLGGEQRPAVRRARAEEQRRDRRLVLHEGAGQRVRPHLHPHA